jgi:hypothetical protein
MRSYFQIIFAAMKLWLQRIPVIFHQRVISNQAKYVNGLTRQILRARQRMKNHEKSIRANLNKSLFKAP